MSTKTVKIGSKKKDATSKKSSQKDAVDKASKNVQKNVEAKSQPRDVKYLYPNDCESKDARKAFRTSARSKFRSFKRQIEKVEGTSAKKKLTTEMNAYLKLTFVAGIKAKIGS